MVFYGLRSTLTILQLHHVSQEQLQDAGTWCCLSRAPSVLISRDCCVLKLLNCFLRMSLPLPAFTGLWLVDLWVILKPVHVFSLFPPVPTPCILITAALRPKHNLSQQTWNQTRGGNDWLSYAIEANPTQQRKSWIPSGWVVHVHDTPFRAASVTMAPIFCLGSRKETAVKREAEGI